MDESGAASEPAIERKPYPLAWLMMAAVLVLPFALRLVGYVSMRLRFRGDSEFERLVRSFGNPDSILGPRPINLIGDLMALVAGAVAIGFCVETLRRQPPRQAVALSHALADWYAYRAMLCMLAYTAITLAYRMPVLLAGPMQSWDWIPQWYRLAYWLVPLFQAVALALLLWPAIGSGASGYAEAGLVLKKSQGVWIIVALASFLALEPISRPLFHSIFPTGEVTHLIPIVTRVYNACYLLLLASIFLSALVGLLYPALKARVSRRYLPEGLVVVCLFLVMWPDAPRMMLASLIGLFIYRQCGSVLPAVIAYAVTPFLGYWHRLLNI